MKKKEYISPETEIVEFETAYTDVITASDIHKYENDELPIVTSTTNP